MQTHEHILRCWNCLGEFDALTAVWCGDSSVQPTKICPFCLKCFCHASPEYIKAFWDSAPEEILADKARLGRAQGPLGERLIKARIVTTDQLLQALRIQEETGGKLGEILVERGFVTKEVLEPFFQQQQSFTRVDLTRKLLDGTLIARLGLVECLTRKIAPVEITKVGEREILTLAMVRPSDGASIDFAQSHSGCQIIPAVTTEEELAAALRPHAEAAQQAAEQAAVPTAAEAGEEARNYLSKLLAKAVRSGASDIHIEPHEDELLVHLRIDGVLYRLKPLPKSQQQQLTAAIRQFLKLSPSARGSVQNGRMVIRQNGVRYELIAHLLPTAHGENVSLKLVNKDAFIRPLDQLGMHADDLGRVRSALGLERGLVLCASPLFSGASTTFYSMMARLGGLGNRRVMSLEAPLIGTVPGVQQSEVDAADPGEMLGQLRAVVNATPQALFVSQMPSDEIAVQVLRVATKALVVSTVEAGRAAEALRVLLGFSVSPTALSSQIELVVAQRLMRKLCPHCKQPASPGASSLSMFGLTPQDLGGAKVYHPGGCEQCGGIGYRGRAALFEVLRGSPRVREMIDHGASAADIQKQAVAEGMIPLRRHAIDLLAAGETSLDEFQKANLGAG